MSEKKKAPSFWLMEFVSYMKSETGVKVTFLKPDWKLEGENIAIAFDQETLNTFAKQLAEMVKERKKHEL